VVSRSPGSQPSGPGWDWDCEFLSCLLLPACTGFSEQGPPWFLPPGVQPLQTLSFFGGSEGVGLDPVPLLPLDFGASSGGAGVEVNQGRLPGLE